MYYPSLVLEDPTQNGPRQQQENCRKSVCLLLLLHHQPLKWCSVSFNLVGHQHQPTEAWSSSLFYEHPPDWSFDSKAQWNFGVSRKITTSCRHNKEATPILYILYCWSLTLMLCGSKTFLTYWLNQHPIIQTHIISKATLSEASVNILIQCLQLSRSHDKGNSALNQAFQTKTQVSLHHLHLEPNPQQAEQVKVKD